MNELIDEPLVQKALYRSFSPEIILLEDDQSIREQIRQGLKIERLMRLVINGEASLWEILEALEEFDFPIDDYVEEVADNLEQEIERSFISPYFLV